METAATRLDFDSLSGFEVSTVLFARRMETRILVTDDSLIPLDIVKEVRKLSNATFRDNVIVTADAAWDHTTDEFSETDFVGLSVECYSFADAGEIHAEVTRIVDEFLSTHKRVVTYVTKN